MHDIRAIRSNPDQFDAAMKKRGLEPQSSDILAYDSTRREAQTRLQALQSERNVISKTVGSLKKQGNHDDAEAAMGEVARIKDLMILLEREEQSAAASLNSLLEGLPNSPQEDVPMGYDESQNLEIRKWGEPKEFKYEPKQHFDIGEGLGLLDFEIAAQMSGSRFAVLKGALARLERALANFMLDKHINEHGLEEVAPPFLVRANALYGTSQLPKFEEDLFKTDSDHYLIPTSEVPLTNLAADQIIAAESLPHRYTAFTPCFRSEAGSAGRDTRGLIRMHQFSKVEMVSIVAPDSSEMELERMTECAESILQALGLPYRVMLLCSGDMGFGARKTYDLEVWLPAQAAYREISSCSNCGDFQSRRMNSRMRTKDEKELSPVHTLNGSGLAVGRTMVALLENYQQSDGTVLLPDVLSPYMGGMTKLSLAV
ncbi:MAG: serine--tRNA ligase [Alphaproteobacteria bacterium]